MPAFVPARDALLLSAFPVTQLALDSFVVSLLCLFLTEPLPIVVLSRMKYNIYCALFTLFSPDLPDHGHGIGNCDIIRFHVYIVASTGFAGFAHTVLHKQFFVHRMIFKVDLSPRVVN